MPVVINGTTGISGVDGTAASPAIEGSDTNTGMFFPAADTIAFAEGGTEVLRINSSAQVEFQDGTASLPTVTNSGDLNTGIYFPEADGVSVTTAGSERFRFGPSGQLGIGGATYGTSGQVLTSGGASAAPTWKSNWVQVGVYTASNSASLDVTDLSAYRAIRITMSSILPATDAVNLLLRVSSDNGSTFIATNYDFSKLLVLTTSTVTQTTADTSFPLTGSVGNVSTDGAVGGTIIITNFNTAVYTSINSSLAAGNPTANSVFTPGGGIHRSATAMNAVRLIFSSGNITSGNIIVEGLA